MGPYEIESLWFLEYDYSVKKMIDIVYYSLNYLSSTSII